MATPYELAVLSDYVYKSAGIQQTRTFNIGGDSNDTYIERMYNERGQNRPRTKREDWAIINDNGISNTFYASKFQNLYTGEFVISFRGTGFNKSRIHTKGIVDSIFQRVLRTTGDLGVDIMHLTGRNSPYVRAARNFVEKHKEQNMIITGHSLGGFLGFSMAFWFPLKIAVFNPPHVVLNPIGDKINQIFSNTFNNSKIIIYEATDDSVTKATRIFKPQRKGVIKYPSMGATGGHGIGDMVRYLKTAKEGKGDIIW